MIEVEKLSNDNMQKFHALLSEAKAINPFIKDFISYYDGKSFIYRYLIRKSVYLIKFDNIFMGYIWIEAPAAESIKIHDIYIIKKYLRYFTGKLMLILKTKIVTLESFENNYTQELFKALDMTKIRITYLMKYNKKPVEKLKLPENVSFRLYKNKKDAAIRCDLQNKIFYNNSRVPLSVDDICYDEKQDYYLDDFSVFILVKGIEIGYGQIISSRNMYQIVNFGILKGYRGLGLGKLLLNRLLYLADESCINDNLYIRVDTNNKAAYNLYSSSNFEKVGNFSTWMWTRD